MPDWTEHLRPRLASLSLSPAREAEIIEELSQHLDQRYDELQVRASAMPTHGVWRSKNCSIKTRWPTRCDRFDRRTVPPPITPERRADFCSMISGRTCATRRA